MNSYTTKVVLIEPVPSHTLNVKLKGKLILNNNTIPFEIFPDEKIYRELKEIFNNLECSNYRLSLNYKWNPFEKKYISTITKINSEINELLYINCSKEYRKFLDFFREIDSIEQLKAANNDSVIKFFIDESIQTGSDENETKEDRDVNEIKDNHSVTDQSKSDKVKTSILIGSGTILVCICLLIIFGYLYSNNRTMNEGSEILEKEISKIKNVVSENKAVNTKTIMPVTAREPFTYFDIEESVNFGLPEGKVALTFDDGPSKFTEEIVNILLDHNIGATFFFVGSRAEMYPNSANYVREHHMIVANHSWSHTNFLKLSAEERLNEVNLTNKVFNLVENESVLFRPPYGLYNDNLIDQLGENIKFVLWNRDPKDWTARSKEDIIHYFQKTNPSGAIYILHENQSTVLALPQIIEWIKQHDVEFVVLK